MEGKINVLQSELDKARHEKSEQSYATPINMDLQFMELRTITLKKEEEIMWLNTQLSSREQDVQKFRKSETLLIQQLK